MIIFSFIIKDIVDNVVETGSAISQLKIIICGFVNLLDSFWLHRDSRYSFW